LEGVVCSFPMTMDRIYDFNEGSNDDAPWTIVGRMEVNDTTVFIYWHASCDYSGFDCRGGMKFYIARDLQTLVDLGMSEYERSEFNSIASRINSYIPILTKKRPNDSSDSILPPLKKLKS